MKLLSRLKARLDPRRSFAARLFFGLFLAFLIPGAVFIFLLELRVRDLRDSSTEHFATVRRAQASLQLQQDANFRAEWAHRRAAVAEEAAWSLARGIEIRFAEPSRASDLAALRYEEGFAWTPAPQSDSVGIIAASRAQDEKALADYARIRAIAPLMSLLRERRPLIKTVSVQTSSGVLFRSPWLGIHDTIRQAGGEQGAFAFNEGARLPPQRPASGDQIVWTKDAGNADAAPHSYSASVVAPVRDPAGNLVADVCLTLDTQRYLKGILDPAELRGDLWFVVDSAGYPLLMTGPVAQLLGWRGVGSGPLGDSSDAERRRLATRVLSTPRSLGDYRLGGRLCRLASARVSSTGWVLVEGFSSQMLNRMAVEAGQDIPPKAFSDLERYLLLLFAYLLAALLLVVVLISRRVTAPVSELVNAAESIGRGRAVEIGPVSGKDEIGRLASAIDRMGKRVERRVETLRRLHSLLRTAYRVTDLQEILARASEAVALFTRAERVWFFLHDPDTNRLKAVWPGWNLTEELAAQLTVSVESPSISSMVFKNGEVYVANELEHDPYSNRKLQTIAGAFNAIFCPVKTEEKTLGVVVATNRPGGFGHEEVDAMTSLADAASLLISNARLYAILTGTVEELRRASRLKDHFLQNVNHELRTPLTSIVGWTDLLEEGDIDEETQRRGLKQVRQSARVLLALIDDLLDLARMDRGVVALDLRPVALPEVIQRSLDTVRMMAEARGVVLIQAPLPPNVVPVRADALRLQQVLWNLLANAIKFTPRHGRIIVRLDREPERYLISIEDDGIGIPEGELPHVFERFRQVDGSPTRRHPGMGIGLALARSLVELHGGTIWAESMPGRGSRFSFSLPIRPGERRGGDSAAKGAEAAGDLSGERQKEPVES